MIDKTYINFYSNWYYKKIGNEYQACEKGNIGIITEIKQCPISEFIKKLSKTGEWKRTYEFNQNDIFTISNRYPWIKCYHREILISKIRKPIIFSLFVTAIKNNDSTLSDYILNTYNLTEDTAKTWELPTLNRYDTVQLEEVKYGETFYLLKNKTDLIGKIVPYEKDTIYCITDNERYILSKELTEQLDEATNTFYKNLNEVFNQTNGFHLADFGNGRFIGYKQLQAGNYHFIIIKKSNEDFTYLYQTYRTALSFLTGFDFVRWGMFRTNPTTLKENALPLYLSTQACGDKFLEYEINYLTDTATQTELDYLNQNDTFEKVDRFYIKKDIYDLEDIEILNVSSKIKRWVGRLIECNVIIDGKQLTLHFKPPLNPKQYELTIHTRYKTLYYKITPRVIDKLIELFNSKKDEKPTLI